MLVAQAEGQTAVMPFWRGESASRSPELGEAVGALCRQVAERLDDPGLLSLAREECRLTPQARRCLARLIWPPEAAGGDRAR